MADLPNVQVSIPFNAVFQLEQINTSVRCPSGASPDGANCLVVYDPRGTSTLLHWADVEIAEGWREWIRQIVNGFSNDMLAKLPSAAAPLTPQQINFIKGYAGKTDAQLLRSNSVRSWLSNVLGALANYYNALNLPWSSDPSARGLYRKYFAGAPGNFDPMHPASSDEFSLSQNYNSQWYAPNFAPYPIINREGAFAGQGSQGAAETRFPGLLPTALVNAFKNRNPGAAETHALEYRRTAGLQLVQAPSPTTNTRGWPVSSGDKGNDPIFAPGIANWAFIDMLPSDNFGSAPYRGATVQIETAQFAPWWSVPIGTNFDCAPDTDARRAAGLDPNRCVGSHFFPNDSDTVSSSYAWAVPGVVADTQLAAASPLVQYLAWVREWAQTILDRDPRQVIVDTRKYAVFVNTVWANQFGGASGLFEAAGSTLSEALAQQHAQDPTIQAVAATVAAVGAALSSATYGISAIVGAVVGAGLMIYDTMRTHATHGVFLDDLGQWKPAFLRGWLGGKIAGVVSDQNVTPTYIPVAMPYGFTRNPNLRPQAARPSLVTSTHINPALFAPPTAQQLAARPSFQQAVATAFQALTPEQITQVVGQNGEMCSTWATLTTAQKSARLSSIGYNGDPAAAIALLDSRCSAIASENQATQLEVAAPAPRSKVMPWVIGGVVLAAGGTALYFALRKPQEKQRQHRT